MWHYAIGIIVVLIILYIIYKNWNKTPFANNGKSKNSEDNSEISQKMQNIIDEIEKV